MVLYNFYDVDNAYSIKCVLTDEDMNIVNGIINYKEKKWWKPEPRRAHVKIYDGRIRRERFVTVDTKEGVVVDRQFWLFRKNDKKARQIIVQYYKDKYDEQKDSLRKIKDTYDRVKYLYGEEE